MLLSFKTSVTYNFFSILRQAILSVVKQLSLDITRFFAGHCPMSGANILAGFWSLGFDKVNKKN